MSEEKLPPTFNPNLPVVHSINGALLVRDGWLRIGSEYNKDGYVIKYDGVHWKLGTERVQFMEDLKKIMDK